MQTEHPVNMETLNVVQQVLKGALLSIALASRVDLLECATLMQSHAMDAPNLDSRTRAMMLDLAEGFDTLGRAASGQTHVS